MASIYYAKKNTAWSLPILLFPQDSTEFLASPTIAAGDFKISTYNDAGTNETGASNLTNTPATSPASSGIVPIKLTASEMNHDIVVVTWKDASGAEWASGGLVVLTTPHTLSESALEATLTTIDGNVDSILADTGTDGVVIASGAITAATIATDAITAAKVATDAVSEIQSGLATAANLATVDTVVDAIKVVTDALPDSGALTSLATAAALATVDSNVDAILADTGTDGVVVASIAANAVNASALATDAVSEIQSGLATSSAVATVDTVVDAIKAVTDLLPDSGALTSIATAANLATVDTVVDAIKAVTDNLPNSGALTTITNNVAAILADTGTDGVALSTAVKQSIADELLKRGVSNVEATASAASLTELILLALESSATGTTLTIRKTDGTTFSTKTLTTDDTAEPITGIT